MVERRDYTLTKGLALAIVKRIIDGEPLFTAKQIKDKIPSVFIVDGEEVTLPIGTYDAWISKHKTPLGMTVTLKMLIADARHKKFLKKHEDDKEKLVIEAQQILKDIGKLPMGTTTKRKSSKSGFTAEGSYEEDSEEEINTPVNPAMVAQKRQGAQFVLERLDPRYSQKSESKNMHTILSLKDLRKLAEEKKNNHEGS